MPRMNSRTRRRLLKMLFERDGNRCKWTGVELDERTACIDHINNDNSDNRFENLQLLSHAANTLKNPRGVGRFNPRKKQGIEQVGLDRRESPEFKRNRESEPKFREWLLKTVKEFGFVDMEEAVYSGAEFAGCSAETTKRYLKKCTSKAGMFWLDEDEGSIKIKKEFESQLFGK